MEDAKRPRERTTKTERERRARQTTALAYEHLAAEADARVKKTERLKALRLTAEKKSD